MAGSPVKRTSRRFPFAKRNRPRLVLQLLRNVENQAIGLFPAQAGVGDGLAVNALPYLLAAVLDVAFHHEPLYHPGDVLGVPHAGKDVLADANLLQGLLVGVGVVGVHNQPHVFQLLFAVHLV